MVVDCHALRARNDEWIATLASLARNDGVPSSRGPNGPVAIHRTCNDELT